RAGREPPAAPRQRHDSGDALPAAPAVRRTGPRPRALRRPHREVRREGACRRGRAEGLRRDPGGGRRARARGRERGAMTTTVATAKDRYLAEFEALERRGAFRSPSWLAARPRPATHPNPM